MDTSREFGLWLPEATDDVPRWCDEIGCGCVIPKQLRVFWNGPNSRTFVCESSRVAATLTPASALVIMGGGYRGAL